jgi:hypothetical protein
VSFENAVDNATGLAEEVVERDVIAGEATGAEGSVISWDEYMAETYPPVQSLWGEAFLVKSGGYLIESGDTGVGKTVLKANLILSLAAGHEKFLGFPLPGRAVRVLFLEAEGSRALFRDRLRKISEARGIHGSLPIYFHKRNATLSLEHAGNLIADSRAEYVFYDPIGRFWTGNENDTSDWRAGVTTPLSILAASLSIAQSFSDHYSKPNENRSGVHKLRGSAAKVQDCGAAMRLEIGHGGGASRVLYFDRVRDGALPFPDRDPSRMPLLIDLAAGTIDVDECEDAYLGTTPEPRHADVVRLVGKLSGDLGRAKTAPLLSAVRESFDLAKSQAELLIFGAKRAGLIESAGRGYYRLPTPDLPLRDPA